MLLHIRFSSEGKLEILSGQRRHIAATMLNQAVPTIIQKIDDVDAKIIVADGNLHRDKLSSFGRIYQAKFVARKIFRNPLVSNHSCFLDEDLWFRQAIVSPQLFSHSAYNLY